MTKTKRQLRAEAVERLRKLPPMRLHYSQCIDALIGPIVLNPDLETAQDAVAALIELLTDEEPPEGDARCQPMQDLMAECDEYERIVDILTRQRDEYRKSAKENLELCEKRREERDEWKAKAEQALHDTPYVGLVRGKQWERKESSDYYCGRCGWKVTDHDSYCPECGGAFHRGSSQVRAGLSNLEWLWEHDRDKLRDLGIDGDMSCYDCPNECVETEEGTSSEECQRRLVEWLMAPYANDNLPAENDVTHTNVDANDENAANRLNSQSDAPKSAENAENGATKCEICDFVDSREKLEADVLDWAKHTNAVFIKSRANRIIEFLDRQAAITERECREYEDELRKQHHKRIAELTAERDGLRAELDQWEKLAGGIELPEYPVARFSPREAFPESTTKNPVKRLKRCFRKGRSHAYGSGEEFYDAFGAAIEYTREQFGKLESERDELRERLSTAIGCAREVIALGDLEGGQR